MNKKNNPIHIIIALLIISFVFFQPITSYASVNNNAQSNAASPAQQQRYLNEQLKELENYLKFIQANFKDEVDFETLMNGAFEGVMNALGDPRSVYHGNTPRQAAEPRAVGEYMGIGVQLETISSGRLAGRTTVIELVEGGAAQKAGILEGDLILAVDGKDVTSLLSVEITSLLRGEEGTTVSVTVSRGRQDEEFTFVMTRERVIITISFYEIIEENIGYIKLISFGDDTPGSFKTAKDEMIAAGATSLIIDIRDNPGGQINAVLLIADELVEKGDLLHIKERDTIVESIQATDRPKENVPVILLVNENTASAAEILAAALQDNNAATLVGTTTYGKGSAQIRRATDSGKPFTLTIFDFLRPNKEEIEAIGITPDHMIENKLGPRRENAAKAYETFAPFAEETKPVAGDAGLDVFAAQQRLKLIGYTPTLTAIMDEATVNAIIQFQKDHSLWPGGVLDFTTKNKIEEAALSTINNNSKEDLQLKKAIELALQSISSDKWIDRRVARKI